MLLAPKTKCQHCERTTPMPPDAVADLRHEVKELREELAAMRLELREFIARHSERCRTHNDQCDEHQATLYGTKECQGSGITYRMQAVEAKMAMVWATAGATASLLIEMAVRRFIGG